jgi:hypothetical protein
VSADVKLKRMTTVIPQWPYLIPVEGTIRLEEPSAASRTTEELGEWCGEWGSYLDGQGSVSGVRLMFFLGNVPEGSEFLRANNIRQEGGDFIVLLRDNRLPDADGCPFLPVYRATRPNGREILQLSGYE